MPLTPPPTDESSLGIWFGVGLVVGNIAAAWLADAWLHSHHHEYISTETGEVMRSSWGIMFALAWIAVFLGLLIHFWRST